jgi:hypothetical protein
MRSASPATQPEIRVRKAQPDSFGKLKELTTEVDPRLAWAAPQAHLAKAKGKQPARAAVLKTINERPHVDVLADQLQRAEPS